MSNSLKIKCLNIYENLAKEIIDKSSIINIKAGDLLYSKGETADCFYFIKDGLLALIDTSPNGAEILLRVFGNNFFIGHRSFIANEEFHASAEALKDSIVYKLPFISANDLLDQSPNILLHITQMLARDLRMSEERLNAFNGKRVASRIIDALVFLKQRQESYQWTRKEIGEFCGAKTETVTRTLSTLESLSLIEKDGRSIVIPDLQKLFDYKDALDLEA